MKNLNGLFVVLPQAHALDRKDALRIHVSYKRLTDNQRIFIP
jgi:hypothetical protein